MVANVQSNPKPIAGIVTSLVLCTIGIIWSILILYRDLFAGSQGIELILANLFPSLLIIGFYSNTFLLISNTIILIGAILSYVFHPFGNNIVKTMSIISIFAILLFSILSYRAIVNSESWDKLNDVIRSSVVGGIIGGGIGGILEFGIIFLLFRKYR